MVYKIIPVYEHYEIYIDGIFYCSVDNLAEAAREIDDILSREIITS